MITTARMTALQTVNQGCDNIPAGYRLNIQLQPFPQGSGLFPGTLPPGLILQPSGLITGTLGSASGLYRVPLRITPVSGPRIYQNLNMYVDPPMAITVPGAPGADYPPDGAQDEGYYISGVLTATGGYPQYSWTIPGVPMTLGDVFSRPQFGDLDGLPLYYTLIPNSRGGGGNGPGLALMNRSGALVGWPGSGTYTFKVRVTDLVGRFVEKTYTIRVPSDTEPSYIVNIVLNDPATQVGSDLQWFPNIVDILTYEPPINHEIATVAVTPVVPGPTTAFLSAHALVTDVAAELTYLTTRENDVHVGDEPPIDLDSCWLPGDATTAINDATTFALNSQSLIDLVWARCAEQAVIIADLSYAGMDPAEVTQITDYASRLSGTIAAHQAWATAIQSSINRYTAYIGQQSALVNAGYDVINRINQLQADANGLLATIPFYDQGSFNFWLLLFGYDDTLSLVAYFYNAASALYNLLSVVGGAQVVFVFAGIQAAFGGVAALINTLYNIADDMWGWF